MPQPANRGTLSDDEDADLLSLTPKILKVDVQKHHDKLSDPLPPNKTISTQEGLCTLLSKGPRASAEAAEKKQRLANLKAAINNSPDPETKDAIQERIVRLEALLKELNAVSSEHSSVAEERESYEIARSKINTDLVHKRCQRETKISEDERNSEDL